MSTMKTQDPQKNKVDKSRLLMYAQIPVMKNGKHAKNKGDISPPNESTTEYWLPDPVYLQLT